MTRATREPDPAAPATQAAEAVSRLTDPRALRALAHPTRVALLGLLRLHGPLTATRAGELLGESSASASFHLRQLAKYGLAEEAGGGTGRERPWRATSMHTSWDHLTDSPELAQATGMLSSVIADQWFALVRRWIAASSTQPPEWRGAVPFSDILIYVTAAELTELVRRHQEMLAPFGTRLASPELRPEGARPVLYLSLAAPTDLASPAVLAGQNPLSGQGS
jgi:DNA-binding transcriptional ArsR family regulator